MRDDAATEPAILTAPAEIRKKECCGGVPVLKIAEICRCCVSDGVPRRSFAVSLIVGTILNLINQGDVLFGRADLNLVKLILTYAVPYCVCTYGAVSYRMSVARERMSAMAVADVALNSIECCSSEGRMSRPPGP